MDCWPDGKTDDFLDDMTSCCLSVMMESHPDDMTESCPVGDPSCCLSTWPSVRLAFWLVGLIDDFLDGQLSRRKAIRISRQTYFLPSCRVVV
jgi:hypothetical protein